jgi:O-antigen/teichoic acid export membrane protein
VGHASALFSSVLFVAYLSGLGLNVAVARYAADASRDADVYFTWALLVTVAASLVGASAYLAFVSSETIDVIRVWGPGPAVVLFFVVVSGTSLNALVDIRLTSAHRWQWVLVRVGVVGVLRLLPLAVLPEGETREVWLFLLAGGLPALAGYAGAAALPRLIGTSMRLGPWPADSGVVIRYSLVNYAADLAARAPLFALPVLVLVEVTATANANFYVAFNITALLFLIPVTVGQVVLIEGSKALARAAAQARLAMLITLAVMAAASLATWLLSGLVVSLYGPDYEDAARILPILMAAGVPWAVTSITLAEMRVRHSHAGTTAITSVFAAGVLLPAALLIPADGLDGAVAAWLVGNVAAALVGLAGVRLVRPRT